MDFLVCPLPYGRGSVGTAMREHAGRGTAIEQPCVSMRTGERQDEQ